MDGEQAGPETVVTRTHVQVLANSLAGTILVVLHLILFYEHRGKYCFTSIPGPHKSSASFLSDVLVYGIIGSPRSTVSSY